MSKLLQEAKRLVEAGLTEAYDIHNTLGENGLEQTTPNQFRDTALVADVKAEEAVIDAIEKSGLRVSLRSEEHPEIDVINPNTEEPTLLGVLDGIDGTGLYVAERGKGLYGTMFALFESDNPRYEDYLAAGIMLHATGQLLRAVRGEGVRCINLRFDAEWPVRASAEGLNPDSRIFVDEAVVPTEHSLHAYFAGNRNTFGEPLREAGYNPTRTGSSAGYYALLALGESPFVGESTRKGNLELATAYALVREAGGSILDVATWQDIGSKHFLTYGQTEHRPFAAVANPIVAGQLRAIITSLNS
jgi:fructose-1,6-bisphosphatase/inositol monophosphatase family enzyme